MASPVDTSVKFIYAGMPGAPALSGTAGSLISVLDSFLVTGFGLKAVDSGAVSGGICRLNFSSGASAADLNVVVSVSGATPSALNGEQKITNYSASWIEFATALPDGPVSGTVTFRIAPLGWEKVFTKTNVAVYRPTDPASARFFLRVDDTAAAFARVRIYESMTDVDTGFNPAPSEAVSSGGYYWWKRPSAGAEATQYLFAGDSRALLPCVMPYQPAGSMADLPYVCLFAGDLNSYRSGDAYGVVLTGGTASSVTSGSSHGNIFVQDAVACYTLLRRANGIGSAIPADRWASGTYATSGHDGPLGPAPAGVNNGFYLVPIVIADGASMGTHGPRGEIPGALSSPQTGVSASLGAGWGQIEGTGAYHGKTLLRLQVRSGSPSTASNAGTGFIDITGPWRT